MTSRTYSKSNFFASWLYEFVFVTFLAMFHELLVTWFHWVDAWGYAGVFLLMCLESSVIPVPSEIVMPPAAFWATQGRMNFAGVVIAGTLGSYAGSVISYWVSRWVGQPVCMKYGKYFLLPPDKLQFAEEWLKKYGTPGVLASRFLPVVRHLISIPAGILRMPFGAFSAATIVGAGLWCWVLAWFGQQVLGGRPDLLDSPEAMIAAVKAKLTWLIAGVVVMVILYASVQIMKNKAQSAATQGR